MNLFVRIERTEDGLIDTKYYFNTLDNEEIIAFTIGEYFNSNPYDYYYMDYEKQMKLYSYVIERTTPKEGGNNE